LLVVAEARIDEDRVMAGLDDEAVKAENELAGCGIDQPRARQVGIRLHDLGVEIGEEHLRRYERPLEFRDAPHLEIADTRGLHTLEAMHKWKPEILPQINADKRRYQGFGLDFICVHRRSSAAQ